jgi:lipopolysaccharide transport system permease protein
MGTPKDTFIMTHKQAFLSPDRLSSTARLRDIAYLRDLVRELVIRDLKLRYKGSYLGLAWSLLNPLAQLLVFTFVFQYILPLDIENYSAFLFAGLLAWSWFQSSLSASATVIVEGRSLIKRPGFPAAILPIVTVASNMIHFLLALPILFVFLLIIGIRPQVVLILLPLIVILQFVFTLSLAYFLAAIHVTFRDTQHLVNVFLLLFFYLSPIFYDTTIVPDRFQTVYRLNPIVPLLEAYRDIFISGHVPNMTAMAVLSSISILLLCIGYRVFMRASYTFVEEL